MRICFSLLPAWAVGLWLLLTSASVWDANALAHNINGGSMAAGWVVLGFLAFWERVVILIFANVLASPLHEVSGETFAIAAVVVASQVLWQVGEARI